MLSFSLVEGDHSERRGELLGDVVISGRDRRRDRRERGRRSLDEELVARLLVHGVLHLLGHDHERDDEARVMRARGAPLLRGNRRECLGRLGSLARLPAATFLAFPHPVGEHVLDLGLVARLGSGAGAAPPAALRGLDAAGRALRRGASSLGLGRHMAALLHWIYVVTVTYGHAPVVVGLLVAPALLATYCGSATGGLFAGGAAWLARDRAGSAWPFGAGAAVVVLDHGRSFVSWRFPWATLGYGLQLENAALLPLGRASDRGLRALLRHRARWGSRAARASAASAGRNARCSRGRASRWRAGPAHGLGARASAPASIPKGRSAWPWLQGNIDQGVKWSPLLRGRAHAAHLREADAFEAAAEGAELVVWPETAVPGPREGQAIPLRRGSRASRREGASLVVGAAGHHPCPRARPVPRIFDSAYAFARDGRLTERYDKVKLVPFGEYVPFRAAPRAVHQARWRAG